MHGGRQKIKFLSNGSRKRDRSLGLQVGFYKFIVLRKDNNKYYNITNLLIINYGYKCYFCI